MSNANSELARIADELRQAYDGEPWHGPSLRAILDGVAADRAAARHPPLAHSIWGLVRHLTVWIEVAARRIAERRAIDEPEAGDFPPVPDPTPANWGAALADLDRAHRGLLGVVAGLDEGRLAETVAGKQYAVPVMLHGTAQHLAYHAGQIALLKRL